MSRRFYIATFGCRTNQADSAALRHDFLSSGFSESRDWRRADVIVVNSCTVTQRSDQQVRQLTRRLRRDNPQARIIVTGCYAQRAPAELARMGEVDAVVGNSDKADLVRLSLPRSPSTGAPRVYRHDFAPVRSIPGAPAGQTGGRTRALVKIQDGCDARCSYCIIPTVRGPSRSVPPLEVLERVEELVRGGFQEVVLTGIHIGTYGRHLQPRVSLDRLLSQILELPGLGRLRLSSIEPMQLSWRVLEVVERQSRMAAHFHVCLQSGSDRLLKKMRRPYSAARFARIVREIHGRLPQAAIGTDVIAGFPGEVEEDHQQTLEFIENLPLTYLHVFPYSDREGTAASTMPGKVAPGVIQRRSRQLRELSRKKAESFRARFLGRWLSVLTLDQVEEGQRLALSDNYLEALVDPAIPPNRIVCARAVALAEERLVLEEVAPPGRFASRTPA